MHDKRENVAVQPPVDITKPAPERFQLRVIVWNAEDMKDDSGKGSNFSRDAMNDLYCSGHLRTKVHKKIKEQQQETDVHWRAKDGKGEFNYRLVYDFEVNPQLPVEGPCSFTLKAWDKDPTLFKSDLLGFKEVDLSTLVDDAMRDALLSKRRHEQIEGLMSSGRIEEMEELLLQFKKENQLQSEEKDRTDNREREKRNEKALVKGLFGMSGDVNNACGQDCFSSLRCDGDGLLRGCQPQDNETEEGTDDAPAELTGTKYRRERERKWVLRNLKNQETGTVWVSVELLHASAAEQRPAGKGRKEPNDNPVLEEPEREKISLWHPLGALKFFVGPARLRKATFLAMLALALGVFWSIIPSVLSGILSKFISAIPVFGGPVPCDASYAKAGAIYTEHCGENENPFRPQKKHWLDCLGPSLDVCDCGSNSTGEVKCNFADSNCAQTTNRLCWQSKQESEIKNKMSPAAHQRMLSMRCTHGGPLYLLTHHSEDCRSSWWPSWTMHCDNTPCEDECVAMADAECPPPLESLRVDAFFGWLILRIAVPLLVFCVLAQLRHVCCLARLERMWSRLGRCLTSKKTVKCYPICCSKGTKHKRRSSRLCDVLAVLSGLVMTTVVFVIVLVLRHGVGQAMKYYFMHGGVVVALVTAVVPGLLCGVAVALVPALRTTIARMGKPLARLAALLCMYWLTGT